MKIVVQNCLSKEYLTEQGTWDANPANAKVFDRNLEAFEHCRLHNIPHAEVVLKFDEPQFDVRMAVSKSCKDQEEPRQK